MHCTVCGRRSCDVAAKQLFKACTAEQAQLCTPPQSPDVARSKLHLMSSDEEEVRGRELSAGKRDKV